MDGPTLDDLTAQVTAGAGTGDSLDQLDAAITLAAQLSNRADAVVDFFVARARGDGRTWTEIGARLGVSKQAARKRFTDTVTPAPVLPAGVTLRPRLVTCLTEAGRHAQAVGAPEVGTEHLLAGLLAEGVAAAILDGLSVTAEAITGSAQRLFGPPQASGQDPPPLSAEAICAIEAAAHHALAAAGNPQEVAVGTEHLLLVLALDPGSRARRVLTDLRVDIALIKKQLACYVAGNPRRQRRFRRRTPHLACSFCGASQTPTRRLVRGPGATICGTCAQRAVESLASGRRAVAGRATTP
jgi:ATP-dependent Clp protease ATP-binding subunit ClpA